MNFELHFWVMQENNGMQISSEVALAAMKLFEDAGIEIPFPQRDLHVRSIEAGLLQSNHPIELASRDENQFESFPPGVRRTSRTHGN